MAQGPSNELLQCAENEWYLVPMPHDGSGMRCSTECPGTWLTTVSDGLNWCFEPLLPSATDPTLTETENGQESVVPGGTSSASGASVLIFGAAAIVAVFALAKSMSPERTM